MPGHCGGVAPPRAERPEHIHTLLSRSAVPTHGANAALEVLKEASGGGTVDWRSGASDGIWLVFDDEVQRVVK